MNKKLLAVAVAGALAAPAVAFAQASSVQIYGRANLGIDSWESKGSTGGSQLDMKSRTRIYDTGSRLGFRGAEDLGNGLKALFVIESGVNMDTGNALTQSGGANASAGTLASRDSYVGLGSNWGDVRFGRQSIYWVGGLNNQTGANYINQEIGWYNGAGLGRLAGPVSRQSNVVSYNSPTWSGFNFTASYAPTSETAAAGAKTDGQIWGATFRYEGPFMGVQWDHALNQAASGGVTRPKITGDKLYIGWPYMPGARIAAVFNWTKNESMNAVANFNAANDNLKQSYWGLNWEHMMGNWQFLAMYSKMDKAKGCTALNAGANVSAGTNGCEGTDATGYTLGVKYYLSKRTSVYGSYIDMRNGFNQVTDIPGAGYTAGSVAAGADIKVYALGLWHSF